MKRKTLTSYGKAYHGYTKESNKIGTLRWMLLRRNAKFRRAVKVCRVRLQRCRGKHAKEKLVFDFIERWNVTPDIDIDSDKPQYEKSAWLFWPVLYKGMDCYPDGRPKFLYLQINVDYPRKMIVDFINVSMPLVERICPASSWVKDRRKKKTPIEQLADYIKVWDLKKTGLTYPQIADGFLKKNHARTQRDSLIHLAQRYKKRCDALIKTGFVSPAE